MLKIVRYSVLILFSFLFTNTLEGQEIDFGTYSSAYSVTISELFPSDDLAFGLLAQNEGINSIALSNSKVLIVEGVEYLDVVVDIIADDYLILEGSGCTGGDPSCSIPFTLQAAYANRGNNNTSQAVIMTTVGNTASAQFPIKYRGNAPPGPPPTPVYEGYDPSIFNDNAYLYIYGSINVGAVNAGIYSSDITISISYD